MILVRVKSLIIFVKCTNKQEFSCPLPTFCTFPASLIHEEFSVVKKWSLLLLFVLFACESEDDALKQPTSLEFRLDVVRQASKGGRLRFTGGAINISSFSFEGEREQGDDYEFEREYANGLLLNFDLSQSIPEWQFDIPQGTYTKIEFEFEIESKGSSSLELQGRFIDEDGEEFPLLMQLSAFDYFEVDARNAQGGREIILVEGSPAIGELIFDPNHWFEEIDLEDLDEAEFTEYNGLETLLINDSLNADLLDDLKSELDEKLTLIIRS